MSRSTKGKQRMPVALVAVDVDELVTTERTGVVMRALTISSLRKPIQKLSTGAIARMLGIHWLNAALMMGKLERVVPEMRRDEAGWWLDMTDWV
jgi:hypothetical protein